jgi:hypothetical protein
MLGWAESASGMQSHCRSPSGEPGYVDIQSSFIDFFLFRSKCKIHPLEIHFIQLVQIYPCKFNIVFVSTSQHSRIKYQPKFYSLKLHWCTQISSVLMEVKFAMLRIWLVFSTKQCPSVLPKGRAKRNSCLQVEPNPAVKVFKFELKMQAKDLCCKRKIYSSTQMFSFFNWLASRGSGANDPHLYMREEMQNRKYSVAGQESHRPWTVEIWTWDTVIVKR